MHSANHIMVAVHREGRGTLSLNFNSRIGNPKKKKKKRMTRVSVSFLVVNQEGPWTCCWWLPSVALLANVKLGLFLTELGVILLSNVLWGEKIKPFLADWLFVTPGASHFFQRLFKWVQVIRRGCSVCTQGKSAAGLEAGGWSQPVGPRFAPCFRGFFFHERGHFSSHLCLVWQKVIR